MATLTETFDDCEIVIENDSNLSINGKQIDCEHQSETDKWQSRYLPYSDFDDLLSLARAIIRDTVEFTHSNP